MNEKKTNKNKIKKTLIVAGAISALVFGSWLFKKNIKFRHPKYENVKYYSSYGNEKGSLELEHNKKEIIYEVTFNGMKKYFKIEPEKDEHGNLYPMIINIKDENDKALINKLYPKKKLDGFGYYEIGEITLSGREYKIYIDNDGKIGTYFKLGSN